MAYSWEFANTAAGKVLKAIQMRGKASIKEVAADLGVTTSAVRLHLAQLQASGAIRADKVREGVGRPYYAYSLTPEAHNLFYKDYGDLARLLLEEVTETQGPEALQAVLGRVGVDPFHLWSWPGRIFVEGEGYAVKLPAGPGATTGLDVRHSQFPAHCDLAQDKIL